MSKKHAEDFVNRIRTDEVLRKKVNEASKHVLDVAKEHGYEVTHEELTEVLTKHWKTAGPDEPQFFSEAPGF